jgi:hypothetical protein
MFHLSSVYLHGFHPSIYIVFFDSSLLHVSSHPVYFFLIHRSFPAAGGAAWGRDFLVGREAEISDLIIGGAVPRTLAGW